MWLPATPTRAQLSTARKGRFAKRGGWGLTGGVDHGERAALDAVPAVQLPVHQAVDAKEDLGHVGVGKAVDDTEAHRRLGEVGREELQRLLVRRLVEPILAECLHREVDGVREVLEAPLPKVLAEVVRLPPPQAPPV